MTDQRAMWDQKHGSEETAFGRKPMQFALALQDRIGAGDKVLELGCGRGGDARLFASSGAEVTATDFSEVGIARNKAEGELANLKFEVMDVTRPFPFADASFTVVYSHLALHYWNEATTAQVFTEISRVLRPAGKLYFVCKSEKDPKYGEGEEIEPGVFSRNGHIRHFFSPDYVRRLLGDGYEIKKLEETASVYAGDDSAFVEVWAVKAG